MSTNPMMMTAFNPFTWIMEFESLLRYRSFIFPRQNLYLPGFVILFETKSSINLLYCLSTNETVKQYSLSFET